MVILYEIYETSLYSAQVEHYFNEKKALLTCTLSVTLGVLAKVLLHVWSYDFITQHYALNNSNVIL